MLSFKVYHLKTLSSFASKKKMISNFKLVVKNYYQFWKSLSLFLLKLIDKVILFCK